MREFFRKKWAVPFGAGLAVCAALFLAAALAPAEAKLTVFTVSTAAYLAFCLAAAVYFTVAVRPSPEKLYALLTLLFGAAYLVLITPLSVPDEDHHYRMTCALSNYLLLRWKQPELIPAGYLDYRALISHQNVSEGYLRVLTGLFAPLAPGETVPALGTVPWGYQISYLPQTLGLALGRLLRLGFVPAFLLGRLCNLLFYTGCVYFSVRRSPRYKVALGIVALLPMALQQAASYSYDGFTNGAALCYTALLLACMLEEGRLPRRDFVQLLLAAVLLAPAKVTYVPLLLLVLLIPARRFRSRGQKWRRLGWLLVCGALAVLLFQLPAMLDVSASGGGGLNWEGERNYTLGFVLAHPDSTARIFWWTLRDSWKNWLITAVGGALSGLSLLLPARVTYSLIVLALLSGSGLAEPEGTLSPGRRAAFLAAAGGVVLLCMAVMLLAWTSDTRVIIQGVQGRYFLPAAAVLVIALGLPIRAGGLELRPAFPVMMAMLQCAALWHVLQYTLQH